MNGDGHHLGYPTSTTRILLSVQLSTKYKIRMSNLCAQHDIVAELKHRDVVTCMHVNAIRNVTKIGSWFWFPQSHWKVESKTKGD